MSFTGPKRFCAGPNFLCQTKELCIYILCQSQTFFAGPRDDLHSVKFVFVLTQKFWKRHQMQSNFWNGSKHFGTGKGQDNIFLVSELVVGSNEQYTTENQ